MSLELHDAFANYGKEPVLKGISISVEPGSSLGIIGPSGSGKSTLLLCLSLLHPLTKGTLKYAGNVITTEGKIISDPTKYRQKVGMIHQEWHLWANKTVMQNLTESPMYVSRRPLSVLKIEAHSWLDKLDLKGVESRYPGELSGGQKQRVAIARALMVNPEVLMLDEITSALDIETCSRLLDLIASLRDGKRTFVYVSHHLNFLQRAAERIAVLQDGKIIEEGKSSQILNTPSMQITKQFLSAIHAAK